VLSKEDNDWVKKCMEYEVGGGVSDAEVKVKRKCVAVCATSTAPLRKTAYHIGSHRVTCHPAEAALPPLPRP